MSYNLEFLPSARKEWDKLGSTVREQFIKKLRERLQHPRIPSALLHGMPDCYKIKLRQLGYRLVYRVEEQRITVVVVAVGKRERSEVYASAAKR
jgi:mRNA interferase RelE/StbE